MSHFIDGELETIFFVDNDGRLHAAPFGGEWEPVQMVEDSELDETERHPDCVKGETT